MANRMHSLKQNENGWFKDLRDARGNILLPLPHQTHHKNCKMNFLRFFCVRSNCVTSKNQISNFTLIEWHKTKSIAIKSMHAHHRLQNIYELKKLIANCKLRFTKFLAFESSAFPFVCLAFIRFVFGHLIHTRMNWIFFIYCSAAGHSATTSNANGESI